MMINHVDDWVAYTAIESFLPDDEGRLIEMLQRVLSGDRNMPKMSAMKKIQESEIPNASSLVADYIDSKDEDLRSLAKAITG